MILFYLVFTSPDASGVVVAIVGFVLTFGSFVYDNLALTVAGVDNGQLEAAYALGYSRNQTFFRIILPQAMRMFVPSYSSEIVGLIKSTSVVGYIAVNDLTKMGDIIRGNTYEAFFPLIAVAVIYFAIIWIITALLGILRKKTNPKARKEKNWAVADSARAKLTEMLDEGITEWTQLKQQTKDVLSKHLYAKTKRKPMILPVIMNV